MEIYPAIDLYGGRAVRLLHGDYARMTVYRERPEDAAREFAACGARWAHVVDLEGARDGGTPNLPALERIAAAANLRLEVGGGLRDEDAVRRVLDAGASRAILGTAALDDADFLSRMLARYGERIAVSVDVRGGFVATHGWTRDSGVSCEDFFRTLSQAGVYTAICTDIGRDGALQGPNRALYASLCGRYGVDVIASGGVSSLEDVASRREAGLAGAIIGKAYYTGAIDLARAIALAA